MHRRGTTTLLIAALTLGASMAGCDEDEGAAAPEEPAGGSAETGESPPEPESPEPETIDLSSEPLQPLPETVEVNQEKVALGRRLYHDTLLSGDGTISCATCHSFEHGGAEPRATSTGIGGQVGPINSPTVLNAAFNLAQFWDGRAEDLQAQAAGPVANPMEMGETWENVVAKLGQVESYVQTFAAIYPDGITQDNATDAIAEFEKSLITPSRFDAYLRGDMTALTEVEREGYETFKSAGCTACHMGVNVGGSMYQKMGLVQDYFGQLERELTDADMGRFNVTQQESDRHFFKVPTLRNITSTAPYLHDGSQESLEQTVRIMGTFQLGRELSDEQVTQIVAFLGALTGEIPDHAGPPEAAPEAGDAPAGAEAPTEG